MAFVVYAMGYNPSKTTDRGALHEACCDAVGGDDFAEYFDVTMIKAMLDAGAKTIKVRVNANSMSVSSDAPPTVKAATVEKVIKSNMADGARLMFLTDPKAKKFMVCPAERRAHLLAAHPKAVILNDLPMADAMALYAKQRRVVLA